MFGKNRRWPAAALAGGLALAVWVGCGGGGPGVASKNAADASGHDHGAAEAAHDHSAMDHGAAPEAVPPGQPAKTLSPDPLDAPAETSVQDARRSAEMAEEMSGGGGHEGHGGHDGGHGGHGTGTYRQTDAGREPETHEGHQHGEAHQHGAEDEAAAAYVCPMHPEVTSAEPGKCSKCGMDLVKRRKG
jgi:hypothetical protein